MRESGEHDEIKEMLRIDEAVEAVKVYLYSTNVTSVLHVFEVIPFLTPNPVVL